METLTQEQKKKTHFRRQTCRLCDSRQVELVMNYPATPVGDYYVSAGQLGEKQPVYPLDLYFCNACGQLQLLDVVSPEIIYGDYIYETSSSLGLVEHFQKYADEVVNKAACPAGALAVDIGCNDATFLRCLQKIGLKVLGVEPASAIAQKVKASGVEVLNTFFSGTLAKEIRKNRGSAAIISANNVMANIEDLGDFAEGLRELLAPEGIFTFESGYVVDLLNNCVIDNVYHEHLCYFRLNPLVKYFANHGLEIIDIQHSPTKGGSLRGLVQHKGGPGTVSAAVGERVVWEQNLGFDQARIYKEFAARMESVREQLRDLLTGLKKQGKTIAGYGASVGVTTLLYYYWLDKMLDVLYDDNPKRHGLYSPGHHIPVLASEEIYTRKPDYILIFAWRYAEPIIKKHQQYLKSNGHFIVPLPGVEVI